MIPLARSGGVVTGRTLTRDDAVAPLAKSVYATRAIEPLCILLCIPGLARNEWSHAFKLLKK